jgi:hypothetical protein
MADIPDTNNAPDSNQVAPQNPTVQPNLPQANPAQAPQVTPAASPSGAPNTPQGQGAVAPTPAQPQTPAQKHASIFHGLMNMMMGQRPQRNPDGTPKTDDNGNLLTQQGSVKQMGRGILAGAVAGMMAGIATPRQFTQLPGGRMIEDFSGAAAAGAQAGSAFSPSGQRSLAQKQVDDQKTRQFATLKNNLDMHLLMQGVHRGDTQDFQSAVDSFKETLDNAQDEQDAGTLVDKDGKPIQLIRDGEVTNEQGLDMLKKGEIKSTQSQMIPSRVIQVPNDPTDPSKGMHPVMMYKILTDAGAGLGTLPLTDAMKKELGSKWDNAPVDTTMVPISLLLQNAHVRATSAPAGGTVSDWTRELQAVDPDNQKLKDFSYSAWSASNPGDAKALNQVLTAHKGQHADIGLNQILTNKDFSGDAKVMSAMNKLQTAMGVNADALTAMANTRAEALAQGKKGPDQSPADPTAVANFAKNAASRGLGVTPGQIATVQDTLGEHPTVKDMKDAYDKLLSVSAENQKAKAQDEGISEKQQKMLLDYGVAGNLRLNLDNAADEMLVDQRTGNPIPNKSLTALKASQTEVNRAQFATSVIHLADNLRKAQAAGTLPNGPLVGLTKEALRKAGLGDEEASKALTEISLLQSAATGAHVGGRFSVPVLDKMAGLLKLNMNDSSFLGSLDAITDTMQTYKDNGGRFSVAEWKSLQPQERQRLMGQNVQAPTNRPAPPAGFHN